MTYSEKANHHLRVVWHTAKGGLPVSDSASVWLQFSAEAVMAVVNALLAIAAELPTKEG